MRDWDDDSSARQLATALQDAVSREGGLQYQSVTGLGPLLELPQVQLRLKASSNEAEQLKVVCATVRRAIAAITRPQKVLTKGRVWEDREAEQVCEAISILLNEVEIAWKTSAKERRKDAIGLLKLNCTISTMRRRTGPETELMLILARTLIARRSPVAFEKIEVEYEFVDDDESPLGVRLQRSSVNCTVRILRNFEAFEDDGFYLIPWYGKMARDLNYIFDTPVGDTAVYTSIFSTFKMEEFSGGHREFHPVLIVPRTSPTLPRYDYDVYYPRCDRSLCARPGDENYRLVVTPAFDMKGEILVKISSPKPVEISAVGYPRRLIFNALESGQYRSIYSFPDPMARYPFGVIVQWNEEVGAGDRKLVEWLDVAWLDKEEP
ncbi:hypothetical protein [Streptomyces sp. NBC_00620]|uniref:hypothetical protein n=1 Tax=Streptomyces sp. NBC_00620 TaxID=2903666 RepID=UPI0022521855|nr:hypothetical protein [Streptomyces sp. NBC_00620]MCX4976237.1 hypothetical protein [Streptomyces sp. NBC_00620]